MRDDETCHSVISEDAFPKLSLGFNIQRAGEIVEDDQLRFADEHTRRTRTLRLPAGKLDTTRADQSFEIVIESFKVAIHNGEFCGSVNIIVCAVQPEQDVVAVRVAK